MISPIVHICSSDEIGRSISMKIIFTQVGTQTRKWQKQLFTFVIMITGGASLLLGAFPQAASAGRLVRECNQMISPSNSTRNGRANARISCYVGKMRDVLEAKDDLKGLNKVIMKIRGVQNRGTSKEYNCVVDVLPNYGLLFGNREGETTFDVKFSVRNGMCSKYWNGGIESLNKYYKLYCYIGLSAFNKKVIKFYDNTIAYKNKYTRCFNNSIPPIIKREFPISDYVSFKEYYSRSLTYWNNNKMSAEYRDLAKACNRTLEGLRRQDPSFVNTYNPSCQ